MTLVQPGAPDAVTSLSYSPDGRALAATGGRGPVRLWNADTGETLRTLAGGEESNTRTSSLAFAADGRRIARTRSNTTPTLWDVTTGEPIEDPAFGIRGTSAVAFDPHGPAVAIAGWRWLRLVDPAVGQARELIGHQGEVVSIAFAPDGRTLATAGDFYDNSVRVWDAPTGRQLRVLCDTERHCGGFSQVAFSPDGHAVAAVESVTHQVRVWRV
jgi:WD40 repeat protein